MNAINSTSNPVRLSFSIVLTVVALLIYAAWSGSLFMEIVSVTLLFCAFAIAIWCYSKNTLGPFEISISGITAILFIIITLSTCSTTVKCHIDAAIENTLLVKWDWIALLIALSSLVFTACTWVSQERTQRNTMRITPEIQLGILWDIFRHSYRNIMVIYALHERIRNRLDSYYPAVEHIDKLRINEEYLYPEAFVGNALDCGTFIQYKFNIRNGNIELGIAAQRLVARDTHHTVKERDLNKIKSRIEYTIMRTAQTIKELYGISNLEIAKQALDYVNKRAIEKIDKGDSKLLGDIADRYDRGLIPQFYTADNSELIKALFPVSDDIMDNDMANNDTKIDGFIRKLNIHIHLMLQKSGEICIIPFDTSKPILQSE